MYVNMDFANRTTRLTLASQLLTDEPENEISLTAFRLLTLDLLTLYSVMNEGTINVLGKRSRRNDIGDVYLIEDYRALL